MESNSNNQKQPLIELDRSNNYHRSYENEIDDNMESSKDESFKETINCFPQFENTSPSEQHKSPIIVESPPSTENDINKERTEDAEESQNYELVIEENNNINNGNYDVVANTKTTCYQKLFSEIKPGSIRASIFNLSILSVGTGVLALPERFGQLSILLSVICIAVAALCAYWTLDLLIYSSIKSGGKTYAQVIRKILGNKWAKFSDTVIIIHLFGCLIIYQIIIYDMLVSVIYEFGSFPKYIDNEDFQKHSMFSETKYKLIIMTTFAIVILTPLNLLKDVAKLRFTSIFGLISLLLVAIIILIQLPNYLDYNQQHIEKENYINWYSIKTAFTSELLFFKGTATIFFSYNCHHGMYQIYDKLEDNSKTRIRKVIKRSISVNTFLYLLVGITGYLTAPVLTPSIITERENIGDDILMSIGRIFIVIMLIAKIPASYNALRVSAFELFWENSEITTKRNLVITIPVSILSAIIGALYSDISEFITLLGGFCVVIMAFFFPVFLYLKSTERKLSESKIILWISFAAVLCIIGFISGILSLITIIKSFL